MTPTIEIQGEEIQAGQTVYWTPDAEPDYDGRKWAIGYTLHAEKPEGLSIERTAPDYDGIDESHWHIKAHEELTPGRYPPRADEDLKRCAYCLNVIYEDDAWPNTGEGPDQAWYCHECTERTAYFDDEATQEYYEDLLDVARIHHTTDNDNNVVTFEKAALAEALESVARSEADSIPLEVLRERGDSSPMQAICTYLFDVRGMTEKAIAEAIGSTPSQVSTHRRRAKDHQ